MRRFIVVSGLCAIAVAGYPAVAQDVTYTVAMWSVSTIDPHPDDCAAGVAAVQNALRQLDVPQARRFSHAVSREFSWVVICDQRTWFRVKNSSRYIQVNTISAMTDFANHVVFLRGYGRSADALRDSVAHEMGHMLCECADEPEADRLQQVLLDAVRERSRQTGVQVAVTNH